MQQQSVPCVLRYLFEVRPGLLHTVIVLALSSVAQGAELKVDLSFRMTTGFGPDPLLGICEAERHHDDISGARHSGFQ